MHVLETGVKPDYTLTEMAPRDSLPGKKPLRKPRARRLTPEGARL